MINNTLLKTVHDLLATYPELRNDDKKLIVSVWSVLHANKVVIVDGVQMFTVSDIVKVFESPETIARTRRVLQNTLGLFPPTSESVIRQRRIHEDTVRNWASNKFTPTQTKLILTAYMECRKKSAFELKEIIKKLQ
jgi:hypothetical protein